MLQIDARINLGNKVCPGVARGNSSFFMTKITKFYLNKASYTVGDNAQSDLLVVDYTNNGFKYMGKLKREVSKMLGIF